MALYRARRQVAPIGAITIVDQVTSDFDATMWRWRAAESRLYPLVMADPDLYQLAVGLVVEAYEVLRRSCSTITALIECDAAGVLSECPSAAAVGDYGFDPAIAFDAARARLVRELPADGVGAPAE